MYKTGFASVKESFSKWFMILTGFSYKEKLKLSRVGRNGKINLLYYQEKVSHLTLKEQIPLFYPNKFQRVTPSSQN